MVSYQLRSLFFGSTGASLSRGVSLGIVEVHKKRKLCVVPLGSLWLLSPNRPCLHLHHAHITPTFLLLLWYNQRQLLVIYFTDSRSDCGLVACASFKKGIGVAVGVIKIQYWRSFLWPVAWLAEDDQDPEQDTNGRK
jgi:hypothetical protein